LSPEGDGAAARRSVHRACASVEVEGGVGGLAAASSGRRRDGYAKEEPSCVGHALLRPGKTTSSHQASVSIGTRSEARERIDRERQSARESARDRPGCQSRFAVEVWSARPRPRRSVRRQWHRRPTAGSGGPPLHSAPSSATTKARAIATRASPKARPRRHAELNTRAARLHQVGVGRLTPPVPRGRLNSSTLRARCGTTSLSLRSKSQ